MSEADYDAELDGTPDYSSNCRRRKVMRALVGICRQLEGGTWYVRRGVISWTEHDFEAHPLAVSIHCDETTMMRGEGYNEATLTLEMMTRIPGPNEDVDDDVADDLIDRATEVFNRLEDATDPEDESMPVVAMLDRSRDAAVEVSDAARRIMGLVATVFVKF